MMKYQEPKRFFEDSGTVDPQHAYFVPLGPVTNSKGMDMKTMVDRGRYFSIFAPRQSGKTTFHKHVQTQLHQSVGLVGIRNITRLIVGGVSPFNIADQVTLPPFSLQNIRELYAQYTEETNQPFTDAAIKKIHDETAGQTWLVNRLGTILTVNVKPGTTEPIDETDVKKALQILLNEKNDHFDNLYEKAKLYKETFVEIVFDHVEYSPYNEDQSWLEQYGLVKKSGKYAVVTNNIYKSVFLKVFFEEADVYKKNSLKPYEQPGNRLDVKQILYDFGTYVTQIGVRAFYAESKPYEKTGQFLLTAWLYQFVRGGNGGLRDELLTGLGRLDIMLAYKGRKYIFETKVNRHEDIGMIIDQGIFQLSDMYLATEKDIEGFVVVFDTLTPVGKPFQAQIHEKGGHRILSVVIPIGKS